MVHNDGFYFLGDTRDLIRYGDLLGPDKHPELWKNIRDPGRIAWAIPSIIKAEKI